MKRLLVVGAGGFGREIADIALSHNDQGTKWEFGGFIDSRSKLTESGMLQGPIVAAPEAYAPKGDDLLICALGSPAVRKRYIDLLLPRGARFTSLVHREADISPSAKIGAGCVIFRYARMGPNTVLGNHSCLGYCSGLGHDVVVGSFCQVNSHASVNGNVLIGDLVEIGAQATLHPKIGIGAGAKVGIGAVVIRNVKPGATVFGNPARVL